MLVESPGVQTILPSVPFTKFLKDCDHARSRDRLITTNGCFDIFQPGHVALLKYASDLVDQSMLVVLLNTDDSISRIKGHLPYFDQYHRCKVIESIRWVDYVVMFDEDTPINLLSCIRPNVHVKGGDYVRDELPETPLIEICGGRVDIFNSTGADTRYRSSSIAKRIIRESKLNLEAHRFRASLRSDLPIDKDQLHAFDQILKEVGY